MGKSNLFDAFRFLKSVGDGQSIRDAIEGHATSSPTAPTVPGIRGGASGIPSFGSDSSEFELKVSITADGDDIAYAVRVDASTYRVVAEELRSRRHPGSYVFSTHPDTGPLEQRIDSPAIVARFHKETPGLNPRREFSPYEFILSQFRQRRAESRVNEAVAEAVRAELASIRPLELRPEVLRQYSPLGRSELGEHGENFAAVAWQLLREVETGHARLVYLKRRREQRERQLALSLTNDRAQRADENWEPELYNEEELAEPGDRLNAIKAWLSELTPRRIEDITVEQAPTGEVIFALTEEGHEKPITARSLSDGTLRFAALVFAALGVRGRQTLVIEEIENGINPARLAILIKMLEQTVDSFDNLQVIASTHSPGLLDFASKSTTAASIIIGWDAQNKCSYPLRLSDIPRLSEAVKETTLGALQAEGWLQFAANR